MMEHIDQDSILFDTEKTDSTADTEVLAKSTPVVQRTGEIRRAVMKKFVTPEHQAGATLEKPVQTLESKLAGRNNIKFEGKF